MSFLSYIDTILTLIKTVFDNLYKMKALQFKIPKTEKGGIFLQEDKSNYFYDSLHFHPEIQITLILKGFGEFIIGNKKGKFEAGDLFIIDQNEPHIFHSDISFYNTSNLISHSVSIFFNRNSFGETFFDCKELFTIKEFIEKFSMGIQIKKLPVKVQTIFKNHFKVEPLKKFQLFINLLEELKNSENKIFLNQEAKIIKASKSGDDKLNNVFNYISENFKNEISLKRAAKISNMSIPSFCRYIKKRTRKTFTSLVNDLRINEAQKLLIKTELSVSEIAYEIGFKNLSHFNRKFKSLTSKNPTEYRNN